MGKRISDNEADESSRQREHVARPRRPDTDEFGGVVDDEDLSASETDEDADEGTGDGEISRSGNDFPDK